LLLVENNQRRLANQDNPDSRQNFIPFVFFVDKPDFQDYFD